MNHPIREEMGTYMQCIRCATPIRAGARFCSKCAHPVGATDAPSRRRLYFGIAGGVAIAAGVGVGYARTARVPFWIPATPTRVPTATVMATPTAIPTTATPTPPTPTAGLRRVVVDASGAGDYQSIGSAILGAKSKGVILVRAGTYNETLQVDRDVEIVGEGGSAKVIVEGEAVNHVVTFASGSATVTGLSIRYLGVPSSGYAVGAVLVQAGTPIIDQCDLFSSAGSAIFIVGATAKPVIQNCTVRDSRDNGIYIYKDGGGTIDKCLISGNGSAGIKITSGGDPTVRECEIRDNRQAGILVEDNGGGSFTKCTISGVRPWVVDTGSRVTRTENKPNA